MSETQHPPIDVKQAILIAKGYVADLFSSESAKNIGLEEVAFDDQEDAWIITVGFSRPWDTPPLYRGAGDGSFMPDLLQRTYKVVTLSALDGKVHRVSNRSG